MGDLKMCIYKKNHVLKKTKKGVAVRKMAFWLNMGSCDFDSICLKGTIHGNQHSHKRSSWHLTLPWKTFIATNTSMK